MTAQLSATLEASAAFFLIADISGRGLVRLSQKSAGGAGDAPSSAAPGAGRGSSDDEQAVDLPVNSGGPAGEALRTQTVQVLPPGARAARADHGRCWHR